MIENMSSNVTSTTPSPFICSLYSKIYRRGAIPACRGWEQSILGMPEFNNTAQMPNSTYFIEMDYHGDSVEHHTRIHADSYILRRMLSLIVFSVVILVISTIINLKRKRRNREHANVGTSQNFHTQITIPPSGNQSNTSGSRDSSDLPPSYEDVTKPCSIDMKDEDVLNQEASDSEPPSYLDAVEAIHKLDIKDDPPEFQCSEEVKKHEDKGS